MTMIERGRFVHVAGRGRADRHRPRTDLIIAVVLAAWAIVLLCGYIAGAMP